MSEKKDIDQQSGITLKLIKEIHLFIEDGCAIKDIQVIYLMGRPVIGICNTWSELTPCNGHFREIADSVKKGVYEAGGFPLEFPVFQQVSQI